jgi:AraC-like DNA-binding protein
MDPLSNLLRVVRLDGAFFFAVEAAEPWGVESEDAVTLVPRILPSAEHLIPYHIVISGRCYGGLLDGEQVELGPGDAIVFPHGDANLMSSARGLRSGPNVNTRAPARYPETVFLGDNGSRVTTFICGFLGCDRRPYNPLLAALPRQMHVREMSEGWPGTFARQLIEESQLGRPGAHEVLTRLAELMFIEVLRRYLQDLPRAQTGWLAGIRDDVVGRALAQIHDRPGHPWTLAELARAADSSRSSLSRRFTELMGRSPMQYLVQWRMQVAADRLARSGDKIAAIGADVGYDSDAAFSRAFKKETGMAPGAWREARRSAAAPLRLAGPRADDRTTARDH